MDIIPALIYDDITPPKLTILLDLSNQGVDLIKLFWSKLTPTLY
jgi:hypothetical protein